MPWTSIPASGGRPSATSGTEVSSTTSRRAASVIVTSSGSTCPPGGNQRSSRAAHKHQQEDKAQQRVHLLTHSQDPGVPPWASTIGQSPSGAGVRFRYHQ